MTIKKKIALVTGASRGIGESIILTLGKHVDYIVGTATTEIGANKISEILKKHNVSGRGICLNITDENSRKELLSEMKLTCGMPNILINNAGVTRDNLAIRMSQEDWNIVVNTNLTAVFLLTRDCLRPMMKQRFGRVVSIGSVVGTSGNPGQGNYCAAKAGLIGYTKSIAVELASRGITANVVAPGFIQTDMTENLTDLQKELIINSIPSKKMGSVEDVANAVKFLSSDESQYITGQTIHVNGGMLMV